MRDEVWIQSAFSKVQRAVLSLRNCRILPVSIMVDCDRSTVISTVSNCPDGSCVFSCSKPVLTKFEVILSTSTKNNYTWNSNTVSNRWHCTSQSGACFSEKLTAKYSLDKTGATKSWCRRIGDSVVLDNWIFCKFKLEI